MTCTRRWSVEAARDGRLPDSEVALVARHVETCRDCAAEAQRLEALRAALRALPVPDLDALSSRRAKQRLLAAVDGQVLAPPRRPVPWKLAVALGAPVLAVAAAAAFFARGPSPTGLPSAATVGVEAAAEVRAGAAPVVVAAGAAWSAEAGAEGAPSGVSALPAGAAPAASGETQAIAPVAAPTSDALVVVSSSSRGGQVTWTRPSSSANGAAKRLRAPSAPDAVPGSSEFQAGFRALGEGRPVEAATLLGTAAEGAADDARAEDAAYLRIVAESRAGEKDRARTLARAYLRQFPRGFRRAEVETLARLGRDREHVSSPNASPRRARASVIVVAALAFAATLGGVAPRARAQAPPEPPPVAPAKPQPTGPVLVPPALISDPAIPYPEGATGDADVVLTLIIMPDGTVRSADPLAANEPFSGAASRAALTWKFTPATRDGQPIVARIRFAVAFHPPAPPPPEEPAAPGPVPSAAAPSASAPAAAPPKKKIVAQEVTVTGDKPEPSRTATLTRAEVREIPGTFGDPFRAIEILPGVTPIVSGLPFFFIRGAPPGDVGYFLDGIRVPLLFHVGVGPSVVHPALMERVDLYPGGYPARFGRYSGGIVAGETAAPVRDLHGEYNVRLFDAGALAETGFADGRGTVLLGGRYSYTAGLLSLLSSSTVLDYWDYQARATYRLTGADEIGVFAFGSYDFLGQKTPTQTITVFGAEFYRLDARYDHTFGEDGKVRLAVIGGIDRSRLPDDRFLRDRLIGTRSEITYRLAPSVILRAGTDVQLDSYDIDLNSGTLAPSAQGVANLFPTRTDLQMGGRADFVIRVQPGFEVTPGARIDLYASEGATAVGIDPRLATRLVLTDHMRLLSAMGVAHQAPAFVVPLPGFQPGGLKGGLQRALQESIGLDFDLDEATVATATLFHNAFFNMSDPLSVTPRSISGCAPGAFPMDTIGGDQGSQPSGNGAGCGIPRFQPGTVGPDRAGGGGQGAESRGSQQAAAAFETRTMGTAYGLELFLKRRLTSRIGGLVSYTLSRSVRMVGNKEFVATFDRTHVLNGALAYNLGRNWRAGTRVVFYTGLPKAPDPTDPSSTRLAPFYRVDLRLEKRWQLGEKTWISFVAEWMNVTLSKEQVATRCTLNGCEAQTVGPITIPSIGVEGGF